jgi:hypothetical protein
MAKSIRIPKTPKSAYNPDRKVSNLLKAHISNLEAVTAQMRGQTRGQVRGQTPGQIRSRKPRTEGQASAYIAELTREMHAAQAAAAGPVAPPPIPVPSAPLSALPPATVRRPKPRTTRRRAGAKK